MIAIDPGSNITGVSRFDIDVRNKKILSIRTWRIDVNRLKNDTGLAEEMFSEKMIRYYKLRNEFIRILHRENPHYVAYEGPFMNKLQPSAYGPLVSVMTILQDALVQYCPGNPFYITQPQQVKKAVGVAGKKGKGVIKEAIEKIPELMEALKAGQTKLDELDDNAIDSIAVGYSALKLDIYQGVPRWTILNNSSMC
jgi:Holliday junction resolvasome RuvABC endonuclease subunit